MKWKGVILEVILFSIIFLLTCCFSCIIGRRQIKEGAPVSGKEELSRICGRVTVFGNEPHTYLGIRSLEGEVYFVSEDWKEKLVSLQGYLWEWEGYFLQEKSGNGRELFVPVSWRKVEGK